MRRAWLRVGLAGACLAAGAVGAASLQGVTPGRTTRVEARRLLGQLTGGSGTGTETFRPRDPALAQARLYYDAKGVVRRARFDPAAALTLELAVLLFEVRGKPAMAAGHPFDPARRDGRAARYAASGVHFYLRDGIVREIWLVVPGDTAPLPARVPLPAPMPLGTRPPTAAGRPPKVGGLVLPSRQPAAAPPRVAALADVRVGRSSAGGAWTPPAFRGLAVGRATRAEVRAALGPPRFVARHGAAGFACDYDGERFGLRGLVVRYGPDGVVAQIEQQLAAAQPRGRVATALGLGRPARTVGFEGSSVELHPESGVELTVRGGAVTGLRLARLAVPEPRRATAEPPTAPAQPVRPAPAAGGPPVLEQKQRSASDAEAFLGKQRVRVRRVWYNADARAGTHRGLLVLADLSARRCKSRTMVAQVRLRQHDGAPVKAARGAPGRFTDSQGRFVAPAPDEVLYDPATWKAYQVFLPYRYIALPGGRMHHVVITFTAACDGDTNGLEALCSFRMP